MLFAEKDHLKEAAINLAKMINDKTEFDSKIIEVNSTVGGGSLPTSVIESYAVTINSNSLSVNEIEEFLRIGHSPIVGIINNNQYYLDTRTLLPGDDDIIVNKLVGNKNE